MTQPTDIPARLKALREAAGLSVRDLAATLGLPPSTYANYESAARFKKPFLPMDLTLQLADALEANGIERDRTLALAGVGRKVPAPAPASRGFAEQAAPFAFKAAPADSDDPLHALRAIFGPVAATPATFRVHSFLPQFSLRAGDVLLVDLARLPSPGELALATIEDRVTASATTVIVRYLPPWLILGGDAARDTLRLDDDSVTLRYPVVGVLRGLPPD